MKVEIDNTISPISIPFDFGICNPTFDVEKDVGLCVCVSSFFVIMKECIKGSSKVNPLV